MTRSELVARLAELDPDLPARRAGEAIDVILARVERALREGDRVELRDFGTFATRRRASRAAFNPKTGRRSDVDERVAVVFRPGKGMRLRLREGTAGPESVDAAHRENGTQRSRAPTGSPRGPSR